MAINMKGKDLISIADLTLEEIYEIFDVSKSLKEKKYTGEPHRLLDGKTLGMIFTKRSTRTRVSFEVGIYDDTILIQVFSAHSISYIFTAPRSRQLVLLYWRCL